MIRRFGFLVVFAVILMAFKLDSGYKPGDKVTDFNLKNIDGTYISLNGLGDVKGAILVFTCNTCPYSKMYEGRIIDLHKKYERKGYPVIAIQPNDPGKSPGDSFEKMQSRAKSKKYPFPYVWDETQEITKAYGATNTPHVYVVQKEKNDFVLKYVGAIDDNARSGEAANKKYVESAVDQLLEGGDVTTGETKAIGCGIKWK